MNLLNDFSSNKQIWKFKKGGEDRIVDSLKRNTFK